MFKINSQKKILTDDRLKNIQETQAVLTKSQKNNKENICFQNSLLDIYTYSIGQSIRKISLFI